MDGHDIVIAKKESRLVPGVRQHAMWMREHLFLFESEATLDEFSKTPDRFYKFASLVNPNSILDTSPSD